MTPRNQTISAVLCGILFGTFAVVATALWQAEQVCYDWHPPLTYPEHCHDVAPL